jgi:hypothetical protein
MNLFLRNSSCLQRCSILLIFNLLQPGFHCIFQIFLFFANTIDSVYKENIQLKKELKECPEETLNRIKEEQLKFQELKEIVKLDSAKIDNALTKKKQRLKSLKEIEKNIVILAEALVIMLGYYLRKVPMTGR